jgi:hypothetical protein
MRIIIAGRIERRRQKKTASKSGLVGVDGFKPPTSSILVRAMAPGNTGALSLSYTPSGTRGLGTGRNRTFALQVVSLLLYQLSYGPIETKVPFGGTDWI